MVSLPLGRNFIAQFLQRLPDYGQIIRTKVLRNNKSGLIREIVKGLEVG